MSWEEIALDMQTAMTPGVQDSRYFSNSYALLIPLCHRGGMVCRSILDLCRGHFLALFIMAPGPGITDVVSSKITGTQPDLKKQGRRKVNGSYTIEFL